MIGSGMGMERYCIYSSQHKLSLISSMSTVQFCVWRVLLGKFLTLDNLHKTGLVGVINRCVLC